MTARVTCATIKTGRWTEEVCTLVNTKAIGNVGEARVLSELISLGIPVCLPFGDNERYDLVADFNGRLVRIQVKTVGVLSRDGKSVTVPLSSKRPASKGYAEVRYAGDVEFVAAVILPWDCVLLIQVDESSPLKIAFRRELVPVSRSTQNLVSSYLLPEVLKSLGVTHSASYSDDRTDLNREYPTKPTYVITCPACHSTRTTTSRKRKHCKPCLESGAHIHNPNGRPSREALVQDIKDFGGNFKRIGNHYGVSDNSVRKWCRRYGLSDKDKYWKSRLSSTP